MSRAIDRRIVFGILASLLVLAGCDSASSSTASGHSGLPKNISIVSIRELTGAISSAGLAALQGSQVAISQINSTHYLGGTTLTMTSEDSASTPQTAIGLTNEAVASGKYSAILGGVDSAESIPMGPIANRAHIPIIFSASAGAGLLTGPYVWRASAPFTTFYDVMGQYLKSKNVHTLAVIYNNSIGSFAQLATQIFPSWKQKYGISVVASKVTQTTTVDYSAPVSAVLAKKPDAVAILVLDVGNGAVAQDLRRDGFSGPMITSDSSTAQNLAGVGQAASGLTWPTDFFSGQTNATAVAFTKMYVARFHTEPQNFSAEAYDQTWFLARAIKAANSSSPTAIQAGLRTVAKQGFVGAQGMITFAGNDQRLNAPWIVQWTGSQVKLLPLSYRA